MADDNGTKAKAPYLPYSTFRKFTASLKAGAIPSRIDKTLMDGMSGSMQSWIMSSLRFFELIDENGKPQEDLRALVESEGEVRKKVWRKIFDRAYGPIIEGLELDRATMGQLNERFTKDFSAETVRKCVSFFAGSAEDAGIVLAEHLKPKARGTGPRRARKPRVSQKNEGGPNQNQEDFGHKPESTHATLLLNRDGSRFFKIQAPHTITGAELKRIQQWLGFQLIVEELE